MIRHVRVWWTARRMRRDQRRYWAATAELGRARAALVQEAADRAISRARRTAGPGERGRVDVADVLGISAGELGMVGRVAVHPVDAAEALRARYELRACGLDLDTDAYENRYRADDFRSITWELGDLDDTDPKETDR